MYRFNGVDDALMLLGVVVAVVAVVVVVAATTTVRFVLLMMTAALLLVLPASSDEVISVLAHATEPDAALPVPVDEEAVAISASDAALIAAAARVVLTLRVLLLSMAAPKSLCSALKQAP
ncbi:hypothetical protein BSLG_009983 [Batrachochytrium salamandrivorans]|nr:hypothetical protein BASA62_007303 [Batrachochytrium salamandrivorans]KAJ1328748.1 hypothetical protein BSLG_009983 [Batrachochytrium salamandrivorans]